MYDSSIELPMMVKQGFGLEGHLTFWKCTLEKEREELGCKSWTNVKYITRDRRQWMEILASPWTCGSGTVLLGALAPQNFC